MIEVSCEDTIFWIILKERIDRFLILKNQFILFKIN